MTQNHPIIAKEFHNGNFVAYKTNKKASGIAFDYGHEQNNGNIKGSGGAVGLPENSSALHRWTVAGPELMHMTQEFETDCAKNDKSHQKFPILHSMMSFEPNMDISQLLEKYE